METQLTVSIPKLGYSMAEVELASGLSRASLYRAIARGQLRTVLRGRRRLVPAEALESFMNPQEPGQCQG